MPTVRPGTGEDRHRLRAIQVATLAEPWPALLEAAADGGPRLWVIADDSEAVVGYAIGVASPDGTVYLPELAVAPERQGEGLGSTLLATVLGELASEGYAAVRVTTPAGDERARSFYDAHGFEVIESLEDHYENGGDGVLLEWQIEGANNRAQGCS